MAFNAKRAAATYIQISFKSLHYLPTISLFIDSCIVLINRFSSFVYVLRKVKLLFITNHVAGYGRNRFIVLVRLVLIFIRSVVRPFERRVRDSRSPHPTGVASARRHSWTAVAIGRDASRICSFEIQSITVGHRAPSRFLL